MPEIALIVESPFVQYRSAAASIYGMHGVARAMAAEFGVEYLGISPSEVKKHATGSGRATKGDMAIHGKGEHESDAVHLLSCWQTRDFKVKPRKKSK
jgi:Holliday junction resolvasome RuvABC endonuclease subunit